MLINRKLLKLQFPANHLLMGFWNALSDGEVKFDLNTILVAQNAKKWGFDLLRVELSKIKLHLLKRLEKSGQGRFQPASCNIKAAMLISLRRNRRVLFF